jgi:hypothetical protein
VISVVDINHTHSPQAAERKDHPVKFHSTQRRRGTETQREGLNIELKIIICFLNSMFNSSLCASVPLCLCASVLNGRSIVPLFESHAPLRLCDRRTILSILTILAILLLFLSAYKALPPSQVLSGVLWLILPQRRDFRNSS